MSRRHVPTPSLAARVHRFVVKLSQEFIGMTEEIGFAIPESDKSIRMLVELISGRA